MRITMFLFKKKQKTQLDVQLELVQKNLENNYKDEAKKALKTSIQLLDEMSESSEITGKELEKKRNEINQYVKKMEGYGHNIPVGW